MIRVADYIIERVYQEGARHAFMVTGRGALFLTDAVAAHKQMTSIAMHHEQAAAFAAVAYADSNGQSALCLVSTGCASTNAVTGVLNAWQDGIPCVFLSGQNKLQETSRYTQIPLRTYGQQEADIVAIVEPITKHAVMLTDVDDVVYEVEKALYLAKTGRKGPVWIDVPLDLQNKRIDPTQYRGFVPEETTAPVDVEGLKALSEALENAKRPVMLIGSGVRSADAIDELNTFVERTSIPVVYSGSAPDTYGESNPLSMGSVGIMGCSRAGNFTMQNSDLLLVVGNRLSSMTTDTSYCKFAREAKVFVVDIDPIEHSKTSIEIERLIVADSKAFLTQMNQMNVAKTNDRWLEKCAHWKRIFPKLEPQFKTDGVVDLYHLADSLSQKLQPNATVLSDSGLIELILPTNMRFHEGQRCIHPASQGSMGYALPALVGAYYASKQPVVAVIGDGSIMMNLQEFETIQHNNIPAKIIVVNNNAYAVIRKRQKDLFRRRTIGTDPSNGVSCPDFEKVASCFNLGYVLIENTDELDDKLGAVLKMDGPVLCEIMGKEDQDFIRSSHTKGSDRRIVYRPLEDQAPFLDRELFLSEMIIDPIDQ